MLTVQNEADDSKKIYTEDLIPLVVITDKTVNSFVKDYHAHKDLRKPFINEELTTAMEPDNAVDKYPNFAKKNDIIAGHLPHGKNGRFAKMIFYFLRAHKYAECKVKITGREVNLGNGEGIQVSCLLKFLEQKIYYKYFVNIFKINRKVANYLSSNYATNNLML